MLSFELKPEVQELLRQFADRCAATANELKALDHQQITEIERFAKISNVGASTRIENAVLTDAEVDWIDAILTKDGKSTAFKINKLAINDKLSKDRERSIEEVAGCRNLLQLINSQGPEFYPLTETLIKGLHSELLKFYPPAQYHIGRYKLAPNTVVQVDNATGEQLTVLRTSDPGPLTDAAMHDLVLWYNNTIRHYAWSVAVASEFVFRFLAIHPFQDGNGRLGRALFFLALSHSPDPNLVFLYRLLAIDRQIERNKEEYYAVLQRCSNGQYLADSTQYRIELFLVFMIRMLEKALLDIQYYRKRYSTIQLLSDSGKQILQSFKDKPEIKLSTKDIIKFTKLPRRTIVYSVNALVEGGLLQKSGQARSTRYQLIF